MVWNWKRWPWSKGDPSVLEFVKVVLFPPVVRRVEDGTEFFLDRSVDSNIEAALNDLRDGINDEMTHNTLQFVLDQLKKVRNRYRIHHEIKTHQTTTAYMVSARDEP